MTLLFKNKIYYQEYERENRQFCIIDNPIAEDPTYQEVIDFLDADKTDLMTWVKDNWMCLDFNLVVHNKAEALGLKCGYTLCFGLDAGGHCLLAWNTTDEGMIYTDSTGDPNPKMHYDSYDAVMFPMSGEQLKGYWIDDKSESKTNWIIDNIETYW
jgi:hypothetical protein